MIVRGSEIPTYIRHQKIRHQKLYFMLKNYFKIAWRNLMRDRQFSLLNLIGLSTGLACALLIYLWVSDELSVDKFNANDSQLYQVIKTAPGADGSIDTYKSTP